MSDEEGVRFMSDIIPVKVRNAIIGEGMPKICVPLVGRTREEIIKEAKRLADLPADIAEWRADFLSEPGAGSEGTLANEEGAGSEGRLCYDPSEILEMLRSELGDMPILFTIRTKSEGGEKEVSPAEYEALNIRAAESGFADLIDVEAFSGERIERERLIARIHEAGAKVIASYHDFSRTPEMEEITDRFRTMQDMGADIVKIAVMPQAKSDVITLMAACEEMTSKYADRPVIAISMGSEGAVTRFAGGSFGSSVTFASAGAKSAPGQIEVVALAEILAKISGTE